jgi:hypothetical protein
MGRPRKRINLEPPPRAEIEALVARRNGLSDDPVNIRGRARYAARVRLCECGNVLRPKCRYCDGCMEAKLSAVCRGAYSQPCDQTVMPGKWRCWTCHELHRDEVRDARNARRRAGNGPWTETQ